MTVQPYPPIAQRTTPPGRLAALFALLILVCVLPALAIAMGFSLSLPLPSAAETLGTLRGAFTHSTLLMLGGILALSSATLSLARFLVRRSALTSVISITLFWSGFVAIIQALTVDGALYAARDIENYIPFTWTITRHLNALLILGAGVLLLWPRRQLALLRPGFMLGVFALFGTLALTLLGLASYLDLPQTTRPDAILIRPWDLPALLIFALCAFGLFPRIHRRFRSHFSLALWLSILPLLAAQGYLIFGSTQIFDAAFNAAYGLSALSSAVIFSGLIFDYIRSTSQEQHLLRTISERETRIRTMFDGAAEAIIAFDNDGVIELWNPAATLLFGWRVDDIVGRNITTLLIPRAHRPYFTDQLERLVTDRTSRNIHSYALGGPFEIVFLHQDGNEVHVELSLAASGPQDEPIFTLFARDLSARKQMQLRMTQMDRMITIGTMAAGVGHEINNPLTYLIANLDLIDEAEDQEERHHSLESARQGAERIRRIVDDLRLLSGFQEQPRHKVSVADALDVALRMTRQLIQRSASLHQTIADTSPVLADEPRLTQVFINLLTNAAHALSNRARHENRIDVHLLELDDQVIVEISDNGPGIPLDIQDAIFEPFFTTKPAGEGSGLGLSLCRQIVESFEGSLTVESQPGKGATFRVSLPRYTPTSSAEADSAPPRE
ncbi:PAS domain S-box protein [Lujinxingia vulgaris]|uniref:histidine kinase n=1 Tax=Lujinxingia vulgaris TaxID=2600176 RepID=A0A5C6XCW7_9DELT|nr:ATP-binding protein [Lujinxingia vulgaris]TXD36619.1 PAS domain S-box protein [Lujinxingia vulgaris]